MYKTEDSDNKVIIEKWRDLANELVYDAGLTK